MVAQVLVTIGLSNNLFDNTNNDQELPELILIIITERDFTSNLPIYHRNVKWMSYTISSTYGLQVNSSPPSATYCVGKLGHDWFR